MAGIGTGEGGDGLAVRTPRQQRTREQWQRVLDAGVRLLEHGGYEAFTIAALCEQAGVPPRALYARTASKDGLFLAVYEHGMSRVSASEAVFSEPDGWDLGNRERVEKAVRSLVHVFTANADLLRAVVLISGAHPEVRRRGERHRSRIRDLFTAVLEPVDEVSPHHDPAAAREFCFATVFSALVVRTAYGGQFGLPGSEQDLAHDLGTMAVRYLIGP
jgi:AcrR family transcriptional regulator